MEVKYMYYLYEEYLNEKKFVANLPSEEDCWKYISDYLVEHNFKSYYYNNCFLGDGIIHVDYGSHVHFFIISSKELTI